MEIDAKKMPKISRKAKKKPRFLPLLEPRYLIPMVGKLKAFDDLKFFNRHRYMVIFEFLTFNHTKNIIKELGIFSSTRGR